MQAAPNTLLLDIYWSFSEPTPLTPGAFIEAARDYAADMGCANPSATLERALPMADLRIRYQCWVRTADGSWKDEPQELRVVGVNGRLTGAELLWELHAACQESIGQSDHHFFEGLSLEEDANDSMPALYQVLLGS